MKRIRRVSIELIRREFKLSASNPVVTSAEARSEDEVHDERKRQPGPPVAQECPVCASPWFVVQRDEEEPVIVQKALAKHGIHTQLSSAGELQVCHKSFELRIGAFDVAKVVTQESQLPGNDPASSGRGDSNV